MRRLLSSVMMALGLAGSPAYAFDCARILTTFSKPERALAKFDARAEKLLEASLGGGKFDVLRAHYHRLILAQTSRLLIQHDLECEAIEKTIYRHYLTLTAPTAAIRLVDHLCKGNSEVITTLTKNAFFAFSAAADEFRDATEMTSTAAKDRERRNLRQWLDYAVNFGKLSSAQWLEIMSGRGQQILPIADVVKGELGRLGFTKNDVLLAAEVLARHHLPFTTILERTRLPTDTWDRLEPSLDALQWLAYRVRLKRGLVPSDVAAFETRVKRQPPLAVNSTAVPAAARMMSDLIYDASIPFALVQRVDRALQANAKRIYGGPIKLTFDPIGLSEARVEHAKHFFGRAVIEREDVMHEKRRFASYIEAKLRNARFSTVDQFIAAFKLHNVYQVSRQAPKTSAHVSESVLEEQAVASVYFKVLRDRLDEVLRLQPNAVQMRFILETPLQFRHLPGDEPVATAWSKFKSRLRPSTFDNIRKIQARVLWKAKYAIFSIPEWKEIALYQARPERPYEKLKAQGIDELLGLGLVLGDAQGDRHMNWLDIVSYDLQVETKTLQGLDAPLVNQLIQLRAMVPTPKHTEKGLEREAIRILGLTTSLRIPERRRFDPRKTPIEKRLIEMYNLFGTKELPGDPLAVDKAIKKMREGLLNFLAIRSSGEQTIVIDRDQYELLLPVAAANDFEVVKLHEGETRVEIAVYGHLFYF